MKIIAEILNLCGINSFEDRFDVHRVDRACDIPKVRIRKETEIGLDIMTLCKLEMDLTGHSDQQIILCSQNALSFIIISTSHNLTIRLCLES